ncbi:MAG: tRNA (cytidine(56)-2'-O)-methyltransferase [Nanoarchaeota archaeon]
MISILRLGHRIHRDIRVTTHLALTARAFLADNFYYTGQKDSKFENSIKRINERFGSQFNISYIENYSKFLNEINALKVHLTMYGERLNEKLKEIKKKKDILLIVGGQKVPPDVYEISDYNISITSQPISEISALAIFLNEYMQGKALKNKFKNSKLLIVPQKKGKKIINRL